MVKLNERTRLWNNISESIATTNKTIGLNSYHYLSSLTTILRVPLPALHPSLPTRVIIRTSQFTLSAISLLHALVTLSPTSTNFIRNFGSTSLKLNVATKPLLIPDDFRLRNSRLVATLMSRLNSSVRHDHPRSFLINSLDRTKSLHDPAPIPSLSDFWTVSALYTRFSTSHCWKQQPPIRSLIESSPHLRRLQSTMNPNSRFLKSSIPR